jgi:hypothetical protein
MCVGGVGVRLWKWRIGCFCLTKRSRRSGSGSRLRGILGGRCCFFWGAFIGWFVFFSRASGRAGGPRSPRPVWLRQTSRAELRPGGVRETRALRSGAAQNLGTQTIALLPPPDRSPGRRARSSLGPPAHPPALMVWLNGRLLAICLGWMLICLVVDRRFVALLL